MAAEAYVLPIDRGSAATPIQDHSPLDPDIEALLEQQAKINAKLAVLLPEKYGFNVRTELDSLRHKLRIMRTFANEHRKHVLFDFPFPLLPFCLLRLSLLLWCQQCPSCAWHLFRIHSCGLD